MVIQPELTLRFAHENNSDYLTCPVAPLQHDSQGNWARDEAFLPPLLTLQGIRWLVTQLGQLMTQLRARLGRLMAMRRESNERIADFALADVPLFWLLNALNSAEPVLGQFQRHPQSTPERLYPELARLAGSLLTFSLEHQFSAIPAWQHEQLNNVFSPLFDLLGNLLHRISGDHAKPTNGRKRWKESQLRPLNSNPPVNLNVWQELNHVWPGKKEFNNGYESSGQ